MSGVPKNTGTTLVVQDAKGNWVAQAPQLFPIRRFRTLANATPAQIAQQFDQAQDEIQKATTGSRDVPGTVSTVYLNFKFTLGQTVKVPHLLGSANVRVRWDAPSSSPGVTAGLFGFDAYVDPANPDFAVIRPWGSFVCTVEFRIGLASRVGSLGPIPAGGPTVTGTGVVVVVGGAFQTPATNGAAGTVLTSNGTSAAPTFQAATGGAFNRSTPIDANTYLYYTLDEGSAAYNSTGSNSAVPLSTVGGAPFPLQDAVFGTGVAFNGLVGLTSGASGTSAAPSTLQALTVSGWINPQANANAVIFAKLYNPSGTGLVWSWLLANSTGGQWYVAFTIAGSTTVLQVANPWCFLPLNQWSLITMVYDGVHLSLYTNGVLAISQALTGNIDYGTNGPYEVGALNGTSDRINAILDDLRVEGVVRSAAYLRAMYLKGINRT